MNLKRLNIELALLLTTLLLAGCRSGIKLGNLEIQKRQYLKGYSIHSQPRELNLKASPRVKTNELLPKPINSTKSDSKLEAVYLDSSSFSLNNTVLLNLAATATDTTKKAEVTIDYVPEKEPIQSKPKRYNRSAVIGFTLILLTINTLMGLPLGIWLCIRGLKQIKTTGQKGKGLAIAGLVIAGLILAIVLGVAYYLIFGFTF